MPADVSVLANHPMNDKFANVFLFLPVLRTFAGWLAWAESHLPPCAIDNCSRGAAGCLFTYALELLAFPPSENGSATTFKCLRPRPGFYANRFVVLCHAHGKDHRQLPAEAMKGEKQKQQQHPNRQNLEK